MTQRFTASPGGPLWKACAILSFLFVLALLFILALLNNCAPARAEGQITTPVDVYDKPLFSPQNPGNTAALGSANIATGTATAGATATLLVPARPGRFAVTIETTGSTAFFIGGPGVTPANGFPIPGTAGASITVPTGAAIYGVTASGSAPVAYLETF